MSDDPKATTNASDAGQLLTHAIKASGALVEIEPDLFTALLPRSTTKLVIEAKGGFFGSTHTYMLHHGGFIFITHTGHELTIPADFERIAAKKLWLP